MIKSFANITVNKIKKILFNKIFFKLYVYSFTNKHLLESTGILLYNKIYKALFYCINYKMIKELHHVRYLFHVYLHVIFRIHCIFCGLNQIYNLLFPKDAPLALNDDQTESFYPKKLYFYELLKTSFVFFMK